LHDPPHIAVAARQANGQIWVAIAGHFPSPSQVARLVRMPLAQLAARHWFA
jgi:hypothetical protein